jgi:hypothetical protein
MIGFLFRLIPTWGWLILGGLAIASGFAWHENAVHAARVGGRAEVQAKWDADKLARSTLALDTIKEYRAKDQVLNTKLQESENARQSENAKNARIAADLRAQRDGLRNDIANFASGSGGPSEDTVTAARDRAATLGRVLGEALRTSEECAGDAEALSADLRSVLGAWPVTH